jgi:hypothetical protein
VLLILSSASALDGAGAPRIFVYAATIAPPPASDTAPETSSVAGRLKKLAPVKPTVV